MNSCLAALLGAFLCAPLVSFAQIPVNAQKKYEYAEATTVTRASAKDIQRRLHLWAKDYYKNNRHEVLIDDTNYRFITITATQKMPNSFFQVNRSHKERELTYTMVFDTDRKDYSYKINNFHYKCIEVDRKGAEVTHDVALELFKTPSKMSVDKEVHEHMQNVISAFKKGVEIDIPLETKTAMDQSDAELKAKRDALKAERLAQQKADAAAEAARIRAEEAAAKAAEDAEKERIRQEEAAARAAAAEEAKLERERQAAERKAALEAAKPVKPVTETETKESSTETPPVEVLEEAPAEEPAKETAPE